MDKNRTRSKRGFSKKLLFAVAGTFIAVVLAVTCGLCFSGNSEKRVAVDEIEQGTAETSQNYSNLTGNQLINYINSGTFSNGNYVDFTYNGSYYSITLPIGTYKFEVWGAQGGSYNGSGNGGKGGYSFGQITYTSQTTIHIYIGGMGANGSGRIDGGGDSITRSGGYNGGGYGTGYGGSGGGGATDIRTTSGSATNSTSYNTRFIIAAGGGGSNGTSNANTHGSNAGVYYGANGCRSRHRSSWSNDEGGGGGGYYGGTVNHGDDPLWSYAGSNYVNTSKFNSGTTGNSYGQQPGNGKARITAISINKPPVTKNSSTTVNKRGVAGTVSIAASKIASDPEGTPVYFTNGTAGQYDTFTQAADRGVWFNSSCSDTYRADKYFSWTWTSNTTLNITGVKKYPRSGIDGSTKNGEITLYTKIRDNFVGGTSQRGNAVISFKVTVPPNTINERSGNSGTVVVSTNNNKLFIGRSNTLTPPATGTATSSTLYNPLGTNRYTAIMEQPLRYNEPVTIKASDLVLGDNANNALRSGDTWAIALNSTTAITGSSRKYRIDEYEGSKTHTVSVYNSSRVLVANTFSQLSFRCLTPDPTYQVFTVTVYQVENSTVYTSGQTTNVVPDITAKTVDIVFKMDNTRPVLKDAADISIKNGVNASGADVNIKAPVLEVNTLGSKSITLNDFYYDKDTASGMSTATHQIKDVVVAEREYIQLDKYGSVVSTVNDKTAEKKSYFNAVSNESASDMFGNSASNGSLTTGMFNGGDFETGFERSYIDTGVSGNAFIRYSFSGITLNITGLRATYNMYKADRTGKKSAIGGTGVAAGNATHGKPTLSGANNVLNAGDFYILIKVQDKNDSADEGIWLPLGIRVANKAPTDMSRERDGAGATVMPTAEGEPTQSFYFTPMGITVNQNTVPVGWYFNKGVYNSSGLKPIASDADNFFSANMLNGENVFDPGETGKLNELIKITSSAADIRNSVTQAGNNNTSYNANGEYFSVEIIPIYIPAAYFGNRVKTTAATTPISYNGGEIYDCIAVDGIKITLNSWTHNRYLHAKVNIADCIGATGTVEIAVKVSNSAPQYLEKSKVAELDYETDGQKIKSVYTTNSDETVIEYSVPVHTTVVVTPYDLLTDANMALQMNDKPFTLNGLSGLFDTNSGVYSVDAVRGANDNRATVTGIANSYNTKYNYSSTEYKNTLRSALANLQTKRNFGDVSVANSFGSHLSGETNIDRLYFERNDDGSNLDGFTFDPYKTAEGRKNFAVPSVIGDSFVSYYFGNKIGFPDNTGYDLDFLVITAVKRTQNSAPVEFTLTVRDRMGAGASGAASGVKTVKVKINVINSKPRVQKPDRIYTLTTNPIIVPDSEDENEGLTSPSFTLPGMNTSFSVIPSTLIINARSSSTDVSENFLIDNEDPANVSFYVTSSVRWSVIGEYTDSEGVVHRSDRDAAGNSYIDNYLRVSIDSQTMTITALNSTQAVQRLYVVFSVTDGRYDAFGEQEYSTCRIQIEVINARLKANNGDNGFAVNDGTNVSVDNLWSVESLSDQDIKRDRYFVSGSNAERLLRADNPGLAYGQVKTLVTDTDGLQGAVLSPASAPENTNDSEKGYYNADFSECTTAAQFAAACKLAVPQISRSTNWESNFPSAVLLNVYRLGESNGQISMPVVPTDGSPASDIAYVTTAEIIYFVNGAQYTASQLVSAESKVFEDEALRAKFFDSEGRWIVTDWAVKIVPAKSTTSTDFINLRISMRDETRFGGGTAGKETAFVKGEPARVSDNVVIAYNLSVSDIGIIPYSYYNQFGGYYTVTDGEDESVNYVPTYDGVQSSVYPTGMSDLYLDSDKITNGPSGTPVKTRNGNNVVDSTAAGVHSGTVYDTSSDDYKNGYTYDINKLVGGSVELDTERRESAFKFSDVLKISDTDVYVPMSYFALRRSLVEIAGDGSWTFDANRYISYDLDKDTFGAYTRKEGFLNAVSISDGTHVWKGATGEYRLSENPYVSINSFELDDYPTQSGAEYDREFGALTSSPYFNNCLSVTTYNGSTVNDLLKNSQNYTHLVGDGHLMYLNGQESSLQENRFGIRIKKNKTRAASGTVTMTVAVAQCKRDNSGTIVDYDASTRDKNTAKVTFKLEIDNSPITLVQSGGAESGVAYDTHSGYYTSLTMNTGSSVQKVMLSRNGGIVSGINRVIEYQDRDVVDGADGEEKSDKARFYFDSLRKLNSWSGVADNGDSTEVSATAQRLMQYSTANGFMFVNTSDAVQGSAQRSERYAQISMQNYFDAANASSVNAIDGTYLPNGGIYSKNNNNGYDKYFGVEISADGATLSVTPRAKTIINTDMLPSSDVGEITEYYAARGLVYEPGLGGYYPLKVIIYDDHGDGVSAGSYVALEVRVRINGSAPTLSENLENHKVNGVVSGKEINVALPVGQRYSFSIKDVITPGNLLASSTENSRTLFWAYDYNKLKNDTGSYSPDMNTTKLNDLFRLETGSYLLSPFDGWVKTDNKDLREGNAKFSSAQGDGYGTDVTLQPDVVMYMDYTVNVNGAVGKGPLSDKAVPEGNTVNFMVNRRMTYKNGTVSQQINDFTFVLSFKDSDGNRTENLYINIAVTNQAPSIRAQAVSAAEGFTRMRVGDSFTVVTTSYDRFVGSETGGTTLSESAAASSTHTIISSGMSIGDAKLLDKRASVKYSDLTATNLDTPAYKLHNYDRNNVNAQHLGYIAVADDDTPWGLRIDNIEYYSEGCFDIAILNDRLPLEGQTSGDTKAISAEIRATGVCTNMPVSITLVDADGARIVFTMYVTVVSSKPSPIPDRHSTYTRSPALLSTGVDGVYKTYMVSSALTSTSLTGKTLSDGTKNVTVYGEIDLPVNKIAYDPDIKDNARIALYSGDNDESDYNVFTLNGINMIKDGNVYTNGIFRIEVASDFTSFKIKCLTYNATSDSDTLKFYIRDCGNNVFENAIPIEINICTLPSSIVNEAQTATGKVINSSIQKDTPDTIYVKPIDDYAGISEDMPEDEDEYNKIAYVKSTYQFLKYYGVPDSIDQDKSKAQGIKDPDVAQSNINRNYELRIYALMDGVGESLTNFRPLDLAQMSALFDLNQTVVNNRFWYLKSQETVRKYLVGGFYSDGSSLEGVNTSLSMFLQQYFVFEIGDDGVSLAFRPVSATIDFDIPFYVEIEKSVAERGILMNGVSNKCGTLFYVNVENSAPIANKDENVLTYTGHVSDSVIFKIHDKTDPYTSLFKDSDAADMVRVEGFTSSSNLNSDYSAALRLATEQEIDWQANGKGKDRAINIEINNADRETQGIPAHSLKITIVRRIDKLNEDGSYCDSVSVPVIIKGKDNNNNETQVVVNIVIANSNPDINHDKIVPVNPDNKNGYYELSADADSERMYYIDAYIVPGRDPAPFNFVAEGYISDPDYTSMRADTDSFRLAPSVSGNDNELYLGYNKPVHVVSEEFGTAVADITPVFGDGTNMPDDENHFAGFTVRALTYNRSIKDAIAYMRIVDRSGDPDIGTNGFTVGIRIHILNAPPTVLPGKQSTDHILVGSDKQDGESIVIDINDYVKDENGDVVKIIGIAPVINTDLAENEIDPNLHCTSGTDNDGELVRMEIDPDAQKCTITPKRYFYGKQSIDIMVADGDLSSGDDVSIVTFRHNFTIAYDIDQAGTLNKIKAIRSLPTKITPQKLFADIVDLYGVGDKGGNTEGGDQGGAVTSAESEGRLFNPGDNYVIVDMSAPGVKISMDGDNNWQFVCDKEMSEILFSVTFKYATEADKPDAKTFTKSFVASVGKNTPPTLIDDFKNHGEEGFLFRTANGEYGLDNNGTVVLTPEMLFKDVDIVNGDSLKFDKKSTEIVSSTMCSVRVSDDGTLLYLTFKYRGETDLTIGVYDRTNEVTKVTFKIKNIDRPEPSFWDTLMISYETTPIIWWGVGIGILVLIAFIILLVLLLKRRRRKRDELEAILISEMELEEQMMRLASSSGAAPYQSYGYLPPTMNVQSDPNLMLGAGGPAAQNNNVAIGLNPGQAAPGNNNNGVPTDSDM